MTPTDAARDVIRRCRTIASFTEEPGCTTRTFLSEPMRPVHRELSDWMSAAGMEVSVDAAGNLRGLYPGTPPTAPRLFIGSHLDTVPHAGAFDGVLGVVMGIALVHMLAPRRLPFGIEVVGFSEEEGVRFGVPFIGSRALAGTLDDGLLDRPDVNGTTVRQAIASFGLDPSRIAEARYKAPVAGYLEFHIEQGPVLEASARPLGVVRRIVGQSRAEVAFDGLAAHAGTTPMDLRRDALAGAAEWISAVERIANQISELVATAGRISVLPGAANVVPARCVMTLDLRHPDDAARADSFERLRSTAHEIATRRELRLDWRTYLDQPATDMSSALVDLLARAVAATGTPPLVMSSGAGHDAMVLAAHMPTAMLFVRSPGGISHHPDEAVEEEDVAAAITAGMHFLDLMAREAHG